MQQTHNRRATGRTYVAEHHASADDPLDGSNSALRMPGWLVGWLVVIKVKSNGDRPEWGSIRYKKVLKYCVKGCKVP